MTFRAQVYCLNEAGAPCPMEPQDVDAVSHRAAGEAVCGKALIEAGPMHKLAVQVWTRNRHPPDVKKFYRQ
jgi:hypothetical protein